MDQLTKSINQLIGTINQLPAVLQDEIWEYVRGDRAYWKSKFQECLADIKINPCSECGGIVWKDCTCDIIVYSRKLDWDRLLDPTGHLRFSD